VETQEILFQRKIIIREKEVSIAPIKIKVRVPKRCNERLKTKIWTKKEIFVLNMKRLANRITTE